MGKGKPLYAERDIIMTGEGLHTKSAIAAELTHRHIEIERLKGLLREAADDFRWLGHRQHEKHYREAGEVTK